MAPDVQGAGQLSRRVVSVLLQGQRSLPHVIVVAGALQKMGSAGSSSSDTSAPMSLRAVGCRTRLVCASSGSQGDAHFHMWFNDSADGELCQSGRPAQKDSTNESGWLRWPWLPGAMPPGPSGPACWPPGWPKTSMPSAVIVRGATDACGGRGCCPGCKLAGGKLPKAKGSLCRRS